ncbi:ABC transporter permease [Spirosoma utsteinense]|uniref:ABC-type antimicrobial peptide transport system permease subunit n=1 Tax=Spirosoma utsteinense TaxID=2585773 RepID=A0ABR6WD34_9BACT|nr:ABC transporter permease [Spirosoma utsteinense]MBC3786950.1 ABC-type antimicrobial peptide transport system permease subunit [Spirosoma utsteinense]MBC3794068.1 ABC-type antimicrobial peptide transport system permease subunit [Spirosoma utsteinense]
MLKSYLTTALRALKRNWNYSTINVLGLTLGLACCLLLFVAVRYELSFDKHNANGDRIYRMLGANKTDPTDKPNTGITFPALAALRNDFPELKHQLTLVTRIKSAVVAVPGKAGTETKRFQETDGVIAFAEPEYFTLFDYTWEKGSPQTALTNPNTVVLSERIAHKYFGDVNPMGKTIRIENKMDFVVTGVIQDPLPTSSMPFDVFLTHASVLAYGLTSPPDDWKSTYGGAQLYMMLPPASAGSETPAARMERQLVGFVNKYHAPEDAKTLAYVLQPLTNIHFATKITNYAQRSISIEMIWAMVLIGLFILGTACINFINLATAQAIRRSREVGVRKVLGSTRGQLVRQFLGETSVLTGIAVVLALLVAQAALPYVGELLNIKPGAVTLFSPIVLGFLLALGILTTVLAGFYPALVLSGYQPILALKGKVQETGTGRYLTLRRGLIVGQFAISQLLIISTIIAYNQMSFFRSADLGYDKDAVLTIPLPDNDAGKITNLRAKLTGLPGVQSISFGMTSPSSTTNWTTGFRFGNDDKDPGYGILMRPADTAYVRTYGLKLLAGRMYQPADSIRELVINETFMKRLGFQKPEQVLGKLMTIAGESVKKPIVGVVKDFNMFSLREQVEPSVLTTQLGNYRTIAIKLSTRQGGTEGISQLLKQVETAWTATFPEFVFSYEFLDETLANFYKSEEQMYALFRLLAGIALFIGCLGLYGVVAFMAETRTKEVGVRKVLGASTAHIFGLFSIDFIRLVLIALVISSPVAWYVMDKWLQKFVYKIDIEWWMFALAGLLAVGIALLTVSFQSVKAALMNPVKSLRSE